MIKTLYKAIQSAITSNHTKNPLYFARNQIFIQIVVAVHTMDSLSIQWTCETFNILLSTTPTDPNWLDGLIWLKNNKETNSLLNVHGHYNLKIQIYNFVTFEFLELLSAKTLPTHSNGLINLLKKLFYPI